MKTGEQLSQQEQEELDKLRKIIKEREEEIDDLKKKLLALQNDLKSAIEASKDAQKEELA